MWRTYRRFAGRREYGRLADAGGGEGYFAASFAAACFKVVVDAVAKEEVLAGGLARALNAVRIFVAGLDALLFGWLPGGAVIYKLEK